MCPPSLPLLGISINNDIYLDIAPPFGCRTSVLAYVCTTRAVVWLIRKAGYFALCYLDDFVGLERTKSNAEEANNKYLSISYELGLALALDK